MAYLFPATASISARLIAPVILSIAIFPMLVCAQNSDIEEVFVEGQVPTSQTLDDLVSSSSIDAEKLADAGIENVEDVAAYVPNLILTETETGTSIIIRGIGAGVNQGFDQSVGLYIDRVPLPRANMSRAPFLDLESVEVLRGPQYVMDGNYSIAGSVHMLTRLERDEFSAGIDLNFVPSQNNKKLLLKVGIPVTDQFAASIAIQAKRSDGFIENVARREDGPADDSLVTRLVLGWNPTDSIATKLKIEKGKADRNGRAIELILDEETPDISGISAPAGNFGLIVFRVPANAPIAAPWLTEADFLLRPQRALFDVRDSTVLGSPENISKNGFYFSGKTYLQRLNLNYLEAGFTAPIGLTDSTIDFKRAADGDEFSRNDNLNYTFNADFLIGDHQLLSTTSYIEYDFIEQIDADFTAAPLLLTNQEEEYSQVFQRLEYKSPEDLLFTIQAGMSYLKSDLEFADTLNPVLDPKPRIGGIADTTFSPSDPIRGYLGRFPEGAIALNAFELYGVDRIFEQEQETRSLFLNTTINLSEIFRATLGVRYTHSEKEATRDTAFVDRAGNTPTGPSGDLTLAFDLFARFFGVQSHSDRYSPSIDPNGSAVPAIKGKRREEKVLPSITFEWDLTNNLTAIASARQANKLGGFDARANSTPDVVFGKGIPPGTFEFEDEDATTYELGSKWYLPGGYGELAATAFYTDFKNLQISRGNGKGGSFVDNAAAAKSTGIEIEGVINASERLSFPVALAWTDFTFDEFKQGSCHFGRRADLFEISFDIVGNANFPVEQQLPRGTFLPILYEEVARESAGISFTGAPSTNIADFDNPQLTAPAFCDFSGQTNQFVAEIEGRISVEYAVDIVGIGQLKPTLDILYNSGYETSVSQDPAVKQDSHVILNGRLALASFEDKWEIAITAKNITNEKVVSYSNVTPLSTIQGAKSYIGFIKPPRAIGVNLKYTFY